MAKARKAAAAKPSRKKSPRSKTAETDGEPAEGGESGGGSVSLISAKALKTLMHDCLIHQEKASTAAGSMGDMIRDYATNKHLHRGAFADMKKLYRMGKKDPGKLWMHLAHFDDMRKKLGLDKLAGQQSQLLASGADDEEDDDEAPGQQGGAGAKVHQLNAPRATSEKAGETTAA